MLGWASVKKFMMSCIVNANGEIVRLFNLLLKWEDSEKSIDVINIPFSSNSPPDLIGQCFYRKWIVLVGVVTIEYS